MSSITIHRLRLSTIAGLALAIPFFLTPVSSRAAPASAAASLLFVTGTGYTVAVAGQGWHRSTRVLFTVQEGSLVEGIQVRTTRSGTFLIGLERVDMCSRPVFRGREFAGRQASLSGPPLGCAARFHPPAPQVHVLRGHVAKHVTVTIHGVQPRSVSMRVGDELHIWESGTNRPGWTPHVDAAYLGLIRQGTTPPRMCPEVECAAGFFWQYVAIRSGETMIGMSASCRDAKPPCMIPDLAIRVTITS